ncbi:hypothetical protein AWRI1631_80720 [Saccharomyces cerevisiae AWRI1631]|uniref:Uncharacterized protein n=1 Tax=Saccharomyces cerevisiae (strain AWRI1631) TaxID=545124 RepID=B5VJV1_YEAS6|nr:hypothetical protein AWRI1631_80720 [Saccharomyces cerevisiae AWRI1631]
MLLGNEVKRLNKKIKEGHIIGPPRIARKGTYQKKRSLKIEPLLRI